jgi:hypothetical protein
MIDMIGIPDIMRSFPNQFNMFRTVHSLFHMGYRQAAKVLEIFGPRQRIPVK